MLLALGGLGCGVGSVFALKGFADGGSPVLLVAGAILALAFSWLFAATLRIPTSFVAISDERTRIRFGGFVDTVVANENIVGAELTSWPLLRGLGVRTNFRGDVALAAARGTAVRVTFRTPVRIWVVPRVWPARAHRLTLSLRNPQKFVERFGPPGSSPPGSAARRMKARGFRTR